MIRLLLSKEEKRRLKKLWSMRGKFIKEDKARDVELKELAEEARDEVKE